MARFAIGVDAVEPERMLARLERRPALKDELFTPVEQAYCDRQSKPSHSYAARFAAKEAVVKALAIDGYDPLEIEVAAGDPAPHVRLLGEVELRASELGVCLTISLTHLDSVAVAVVLAVPEGLSS